MTFFYQTRLMKIDGNFEVEDDSENEGGIF